MSWMRDRADGRTADTGARIGPNAILQLVEPVERTLGHGAMARLLAQSRTALPSGDEMIDEADVAEVHQTLYRLHPAEARAIARAAGAGTARYIRANRIPAPARLALSLLPCFIGARLLTKAIAAHAWTFCGSGSLEVHAGDPIHFELRNNPVLRGVENDAPLCHWHAAVFEELFSSLLGRRYLARETACCAMGAPACVFTVTRDRDREVAGALPPTLKSPGNGTAGS